MEVIPFMAIMACIAITFVGIAEILKLEQYERGWSEGFSDAMRHRHDFESTDDEERVKEIVTKAIKKYIRDEGYYKRGDVKKLESTADFGELKNEIHKICVMRKEEEK